MEGVRLPSSFREVRPEDLRDPAALYQDGSDRRGFGSLVPGCSELYEYFYPFRREWDDQKHRHTLGPGEVKELIAAARRARAGGGP